MKVVVTGGAGFIGRATAQKLLQLDHNVYLVDCLQRRVHPTGGWPDDVRDVVDVKNQADVRLRDTWREIFDWEPDAILHLAAYQDYMPDYSTFIDTNVTSTAMLFERAREVGWQGQVVVASSQSVLGEGMYDCLACANRYHGTPRGPRGISTGRNDDLTWDTCCPSCRSDAVIPSWTTEDEARPTSPYGVSKYGEELIALTLGRLNDVPTVGLRYSIVQGPGQSPWNAYSGVMRAVCLQLLAGRDVMLFEDGQQMRDFVSIHDVVDANVRALNGFLPPGAYHVGGGRGVSVRTLAIDMREISCVDVKIVTPGWFRIGDVRHTLSDVSKLRDNGWHPLSSDHMTQSTWEPYWEWLSSRDLDAGAVVDQAFSSMRRNGVLVEVNR